MSVDLANKGMAAFFGRQLPGQTAGSQQLVVIGASPSSSIGDVLSVLAPAAVGAVVGYILIHAGLPTAGWVVLVIGVGLTVLRTIYFYAGAALGSL